MRHAFTLSAGAAFTGGALRIGTAFFTTATTTAATEVLYGIIDICFLFGLLGFYTLNFQKLGNTGLLGFVVAITGVATILGPDPVLEGVDFYFFGAGVFAIGLIILAIAMIGARVAPAAAICFILTLAFGALSSMTTHWIFFQLSGGALGIGYCLIGATIFKARPHASPLTP